MTQLFDWARSMPRPRAILIVCAHWEAAPLSLSSTAAHVTPVYDFGGFDPMYYRMRYDTPDAAEFGARVLGALGGGEAVHQQQTAASTTAPGCRSRSCTPRPTSRSCS